MARKRAKKCEPSTEEDHKSDHALAMDRISKLPNCVIHHILSFVHTVDAVRTSLLSKRWRTMWHFVPALKFDDEADFKNQKAFSVFVKKCLKHRRRALRFIDGSTVTTFELTKFHCLREWLIGLSKWFGSNVIMNNIKKLNLTLFPENTRQKFFSLPAEVLNGRSLTHLRLQGCLKISSLCSVNLPSLKSLLLFSIRVHSEVLYNLLTRCPSLEECVLNGVFPVLQLRISSPSLRFLIISSECDELKVEANNLQSLKLESFCGIDVSSCKAIRDLTIIDYVPELEVDDQISKLPLLENLTLFSGCVHQLNISSQSLKHLSFHKDRDGLEYELEVVIDTPNLVSFRYEGDMKLRMSTGLLHRSAKGKFVILGPSSELINFLSNINPTWNSFDLYIFSDTNDKSFDLPKNLMEISLLLGILPT